MSIHCFFHYTNPIYKIICGHKTAVFLYKYRVFSYLQLSTLWTPSLLREGTITHSFFFSYAASHIVPNTYCVLQNIVHHSHLLFITSLTGSSMSPNLIQALQEHKLNPIILKILQFPGLFSTCRCGFFFFFFN